jgi:hypothetical protein
MTRIRVPIARIRVPITRIRVTVQQSTSHERMSLFHPYPCAQPIVMYNKDHVVRTLNPADHFFLCQ